MKNINVFLVNSFTAQESGGNPAGVVLNADELSDSQKLAIAQEVGFSETAFVSRDPEADFAVSFFTTTTEVDFCGHATLAVFSTLFRHGLVKAGSYTQRTKAGLLGVSIDESGLVTMEQALPQFLGTFRYDEIAKLIGIDVSVLSSTKMPIEVISTGLADIIVPVPFGTLDKISCDDSLIADFSKIHNVVGIHAFELENTQSPITASCRNFAPLFGISEESATGSASGALACYLTKHVFINSNNHFVFEQGRAMGCSSLITASVESNNKQIKKVIVGGTANEIGTRRLSVS
ncbi:PhzF family phenazine biosynthesis protein [Pseudoalteromonas sp. N1230-9]|uniref:PhzF family phenazine biosynthesis protein n=1 Tax=Pseudoalteromonas sp. N1230-9 TaxID=2907156 RepID=UPI002B2FF0CB|nr:PhzF family phenazine biosynthesis protein [Pseudoalteromonas sp. N1230-9]